MSDARNLNGARPGEHAGKWGWIEGAIGWVLAVSVALLVAFLVVIAVFTGAPRVMP